MNTLKQLAHINLESTGELNDIFHPHVAITAFDPIVRQRHLSVCLAAAHSLIQLKENSGYQLYFDVLVGERKGGKNLIADQMNDLKTPERAIKFAFDQGIGFVPYGGYGMEAVRAWKKRSNSPTRAAAARELADDPDPRSGRALSKALSDKDWVVRAAALEAISKRGDPALLPDASQAMSDKKDIVRFSAAAAVVHLARIAEKKKAEVMSMNETNLGKAGSCCLGPGDLGENCPWNPQNREAIRLANSWPMGCK